VIVTVTAHLLHVGAETIQSLALVRFRPPAISEPGSVTIETGDTGSSHSVCRNRRPTAQPDTKPTNATRTDRARSLHDPHGMQPLLMVP
jgi:hypothetical protein